MSRHHRLRQYSYAACLHQPPGPQAQPTSGLTTALQAAACCSSPTRHTPLHLASHDGNSQLVTALLRCGARWDLRDRGGNTPLFLACELGHAAVVDALLEAGPDAALVKNNAGELPLYIAALRGHQRCVSRLITNWQTMGVLWQVRCMQEMHVCARYCLPFRACWAWRMHCVWYCMPLE